MTSIVVKHLYTRFKNNNDVGVAYLYCNFQVEHKQPTDLLASLLRQLAANGQDHLLERIKRLYEDHQEGQTRPEFNEVSEELRHAVAARSKTFILIDALDECRIADGGRKRFLSEISKL